MGRPKGGKKGNKAEKGREAGAPAATPAPAAKASGPGAAATAATSAAGTPGAVPAASGPRPTGTPARSKDDGAAPSSRASGAPESAARTSSPAASRLRLSPERFDKVKFLLTRYPRSQAAMLPVLRLAQEEFGHISPEVEEYVAGLINVPPIEVHEAASFYTLFYKKPVGRHVVALCTNVSCYLRGATSLLAHCIKKLGIKPGETTADGRVTLFAVECLASCDQAPCAQIDDESYTGPLDAPALDKLLDGLS